MLLVCGSLLSLKILTGLLQTGSCLLAALLTLQSLLVKQDFLIVSESFLCETLLLLLKLKLLENGSEALFTLKLLLNLHLVPPQHI
jgi:hypothetical protein